MIGTTTASPLSSRCKASLQFNIPTIIGRQEIGAHEKRYDVGALQMFIDLDRSLVTRGDLPVMPDLDKVLMTQHRHRGLKLFSQRLVLRRIGAENLDTVFAS
jgi:hypothetical protein